MRFLGRLLVAMLVEKFCAAAWARMFARADKENERRNISFVGGVPDAPMPRNVLGDYPPPWIPVDRRALLKGSRIVPVEFEQPKRAKFLSPEQEWAIKGIFSRVYYESSKRALEESKRMGGG